MKQILVYSDSLTWGIIPNTRERLAFEDRWPGVMEKRLNHGAQKVRVIENCLNGRRTVWDDPYKPGRNGLVGLAQVIECHSPLSLVILMLGTNDFQSMHPHNAWHSAQGIQALIHEIRMAPIEPGMPAPPILVVAPPPVQTPKGPIALKFHGAETKCAGLAEAFEQAAAESQVYFFDAHKVTDTSRVDGVHLDKDQHHRLGEAIAIEAERILELEGS